MRRFYLAGQTNFGNRGCEALVRSTVHLLQTTVGDAEFLVPSFDADADKKQWPEHAQSRVTFVPVPVFPRELRWWSRLNRLVPSVAQTWVPPVDLDQYVASYLGKCDAIIGSGGDILSLEYGLGPLFWNTGILEYFTEHDIPCAVWAASIGPFSANPPVEARMTKFLQRLKSVTVRESTTFAYLRGLGVSANLEMARDPAFVLPVQEPGIAMQRADVGQKGILGLNVSPLILKFRKTEEHAAGLVDEVRRFIRGVVEKQSLTVLLIPHVFPLTGDKEDENNDYAFMARILSGLEDLGAAVTLLDRKLNACQLKGAIANCRYFIGARTHSTIAALSSGVPTVSIAYSVKARGINKDLFGHERYVLDTPSVTEETLNRALLTLEREEEEIKNHLSKTIPLWKEESGIPAERIAGWLEK